MNYEMNAFGSLLEINFATDFSYYSQTKSYNNSSFPNTLFNFFNDSHTFGVQKRAQIA